MFTLRTKRRIFCEDNEEICPECGWSKLASAKLPHSQQNGKAFRIKPNKGLAKATGIFLIIFGVISIGNPLAFFLDLFAGINILRLKEKGRQRAISIQIIQLIIGGIGFIIIAIYAFQYTMLLEKYAYYLVITPFMLIIHGIALYILKRPSVQMAFFQKLS